MSNRWNHRLRVSVFRADAEGNIPATRGYDTAPPALPSRCGRPLRRVEAVWGPLFDDPVCARPEGHNGPCRSAMSLERARQQDRVRQRRWRQERSRAA